MATAHNDTLVSLDPTRYLRPPVVDVPGGVALGIALVTAASKQLPPAPKRALKQLRQTVIALQKDWSAQRQAELVTDEDRRPADQRLDRAWAAVAVRLESLAVLPAALAQSKQAAQLYARLFPTGLDFLKLAFEREWAESEQRLGQIADEEVEGPLAELVGDFLLAELRDAHANYGRVLGITSTRTQATVAPNLLDPLRTVQQAIVGYALQVVAAAHADPELAGAARAALRPIDELREAQARRAVSRDAGGAGAGSEVVVTPTTPVPEADEG
jgi:hypothetical protein